MVRGGDRDNCAHYEASMKLHPEVNLGPNVKYTIRTHLKTVTSLTVMTSS